MEYKRGIHEIRKITNRNVFLCPMAAIYFFYHRVLSRVEVINRYDNYYNEAGTKKKFLNDHFCLDTQKKTTICTSDMDSNPNLTIIGSLVSYVGQMMPALIENGAPSRNHSKLVKKNKKKKKKEAEPNPQIPAPKLQPQLDIACLGGGPRQPINRNMTFILISI
uniref:Uncharacterized protein n=1 Tax=Timema bartmani TaxID=61472 RepID=A0A7R9EPK6_9NEOP|nr:unnamed protein product [Timema bartmani]